MLIFAFFTQLARCAYSDTDMPNSKTVDANLSIKWKFNDDSTIEFGIIWKKLTWLGIGFGSGMTNVDMICVNVANNDLQFLDLYSTGTTTPTTDSSQDYQVIGESVSTTGWSIRVKRKLTSDDSKDKKLVKGSSYSMSYAYSSAKSMERHSTTKSFTLQLTDATPAPTNPTNSTGDDGAEGEEGEEDELEEFTDKDLTGSIKVNSRFTLKWLIDSANNTVDFAILWKRKSWIGIGLGLGMLKVDMIVVNLTDDDKVEVLDCYSTDYQAPSVDTSNDVTLVSYKLGVESVSVRFRRDLDTKDKNDKKLVEDKDYTFTYAYSYDNKMKKHTSTREFQFTFNATDQVVESSQNSLLSFMICLIILLV